MCLRRIYRVKLLISCYLPSFLFSGFLIVPHRDRNLKTKTGYMQTAISWCNNIFNINLTISRLEKGVTAVPQGKNKALPNIFKLVMHGMRGNGQTAGNFVDAKVFFITEFIYLSHSFGHGG